MAPASSALVDEVKRPVTMHAAPRCSNPRSVIGRSQVNLLRKAALGFAALLLLAVLLAPALFSAGQVLASAATTACAERWHALTAWVASLNKRRQQGWARLPANEEGEAKAGGSQGQGWSSNGAPEGLARRSTGWLPQQPPQTSWAR